MDCRADPGKPRT